MRAEQGLRAGGIEEAFGSGDEGTQELRLCQRVPGGAPVRAHRHQAALSEKADMFAHRGLGQAHVFDQIADSVFTRGEVLHDRQPRRFCKCLEQVGVRCRRHLVEGCPLLFIHSHMAIIALYDDIFECDMSLDAKRSSEVPARPRVDCQPPATRALLDSTESGGAYGTRTRVKGFADRCLSSRPRHQAAGKISRPA